MAMPPPKTRSRDRIAGRLVARYIDAVYGSSTPPALVEEYFEVFRKAHPFIIAMWHGQFMLLPTLARSGIPTRVMLAMHSDAEAMGEALRRFDLDLIRGAGAGIKGRDRGGAHAFRAAVNALNDGFSVAMTADVPPGPARRAGHGIVTLAKISGRPILPVALASSRFLTLNTWSRMTINLPMSRIGASIGELVHVPAGASAEELEKCRVVVEEQLNIATFDAYARAGGDLRRATPGSALSSLGGVDAPAAKLKAYRALTRLAEPFVPALLKLRERRGKEDAARRHERFGLASQARPDGRLIWFHAASVGETTSILPLIQEMKARAGADNILLTTGTVTSARLAASRLGATVIHQYVPLDGIGYVRRFFAHWRPDLGVFTESEIWPNLILEAHARGVPLAIVNARMSKTSFRRWRSNASVSRPLFTRFSAVLAQSRSDAARFAELGSPPPVVTGNLKIDVPPPPADPAEVMRLEREIARRPILLATSTHDGEEAIIAAAHKRLVAGGLSDLLTIIAPRHPDRASVIADKMKVEGLRSGLRSRGARPDASTDIYLVDTIGELGTFYRLSRIAIVGGSLVPHGGQNPIEAVRHQCAVMTGPHWTNFTESYQALFAEKGALQVRDAEEIAAAAGRLLGDPAERTRMLERAEKAIERLSGALPRTLDALLQLLPPTEGHAENRQGDGPSRAQDLSRVV
jgi:3-deoxy-D-manno-octulosonic-acid transferase